jgi:hypothetical protein
MSFTHWLGRQIDLRAQYTKTATIVVREGDKSTRMKDSDLVHGMDRPFDVQEIVLRLTALDEQGAVIDPQPTVLDRMITMRFFDVCKNERIANDLPFRRLPSGEIIWVPRSPLVMHRHEAFEALFEARESFAIAGAKVAVKAIEIRLSPEGETLVFAPTIDRSRDAPSQTA